MNTEKYNNAIFLETKFEDNHIIITNDDTEALQKMINDYPNGLKALVKILCHRRNQEAAIACSIQETEEDRSNARAKIYGITYVLEELRKSKKTLEEKQ